MKSVTSNRPTLLLVLCLAWLPCAADQLIYTPVNPTFGGNPNNASGLLAIANAQNDFKAPPVERITNTQTALEKFNDRLLNSVLSRLNSQLLGDLFDPDGGLTAGSTVRSGNYEITVTAATADCGCPAGSLVLTTRDVTIADSTTSIIIGSNQ